MNLHTLLVITWISWAIFKSSSFILHLIMSVSSCDVVDIYINVTHAHELRMD